MSGDRPASPFAGYDVLAKWDGPSFNRRTREVLAERLTAIPRRRFLAADEWALLDAVIDRLVPQPERADKVAILPWVDAQLAEGRGDGYRREGMPPARAAWRQGLAALAEEARIAFGTPFTDLPTDRQDSVLRDVQRGEVRAAGWHGLSPRHFFADLLLRTVVSIYYAHPAAWNEIGFGGPAGPRGYVRLGFDERDPWEAEERG